jgi:hypothetical protein
MLLSVGERTTMALLAIALHHRGEDAISFTGSQSGILTNDRHFDARIIEVRPYRIEDELARGRVVIVAGYQGMSYRREITTLGRGGSDTTAVALAAALRADRCEIYSDVDGVYTAEVGAKVLNRPPWRWPRVVPGARHLPVLVPEERARRGHQILEARDPEVEGALLVPLAVVRPELAAGDHEEVGAHGRLAAHAVLALDEAEEGPLNEIRDVPRDAPLKEPIHGVEVATEELIARSAVACLPQREQLLVRRVHGPEGTSRRFPRHRVIDLLPVSTSS